MRYLKRYKEIFEANPGQFKIPDNFIELSSIGHVLDPDTGLAYPMFNRLSGSYDKDNPHDVFDGIYDTLHPDEKSIIDSLTTSSKELVGDKIDHKFIDDVKDILMEMVDDGYRVDIHIEVGTFLVGHEFISNRDSYSNYDIKLFPGEVKYVKHNNSFSYIIKVQRNSRQFVKANTDVDILIRLITYIRQSGMYFDEVRDTSSRVMFNIPQQPVQSRLSDEVLTIDKAIELNIDRFIGDINKGFILMCEDIHVPIPINESHKPLIEIKSKGGNVLKYKDEWKTPRSKERNDLTRYLMDILQELVDDGYVVNDGGWLSSSDHPYIWISSRRRQGGMDWSLVDDCVLRAKDYLESTGFMTEVEKLNPNSRNAQMYLYFDKQKVNESDESDPWKIPQEISNINDYINDILIELKDDGVVDYYIETGDFNKVPYDEISIAFTHVIGRNKFNADLVSEYILRISDYVESIGWEVEDVDYEFRYKPDLGIIHGDIDSFISETSGQELQYVMVYIERKSVNEAFLPVDGEMDDEMRILNTEINKVSDYVDEIFLELKDMGFFIRWSRTDMMSLKIEISKHRNRIDEINEPVFFTFNDEIKYVIDSAVAYLESLGWRMSSSLIYFDEPRNKPWGSTDMSELSGRIIDKIVLRPWLSDKDAVDVVSKAMQKYK